MKVYISADIEGICGIANWEETGSSGYDYRYFQNQMTREVRAACDGANRAGASEIFVKDAHGTGRNIIPDQLPDNAILIREWSEHPFHMVECLESSFDALLYIGYHAGAASAANTLAHTFRFSRVHSLKINGEYVSEFLVNSYTAAMVGVPVVFLSGDEGICREAKGLNPHIETIATKTVEGGATLSRSPNTLLSQIAKGVERSLKGDLTPCRIPLPAEFEVELCYRIPLHAYRASFYPGVKRIDARTIGYRHSDYFEILRLLHFVL